MDGVVVVGRSTCTLLCQPLCPLSLNIFFSPLLSTLPASLSSFCQPLSLLPATLQRTCLFFFSTLGAKISARFHESFSHGSAKSCSLGHNIIIFSNLNLINDNVDTAHCVLLRVFLG